MNQTLYFHASASSGGSEEPSNAPDSEDSHGQIRVFLVDDHPAIREALTSAIGETSGLTVVGESAGASEALSLVEQREPDVVVIDISLEDADGLMLIRQIRSRVPEARMLVFSGYDENVYAERSVRAGASGYVMKSKPTSEVIHAIEEIWEGQVYLSRHTTSRILSKFIQSGEDATSSSLEELTDRELTVFRMLGEGLSVRQIADQLDLSRKTIETYRRRAKEKLGYETTADLLRHAVQWTSSQEETSR